MELTEKLNDDWLTSLLADLGGTGDEVAGTLRSAGAQGTPADIHNDPVAAYVAARVRGLLPETADIEVAATADEVVVGVYTVFPDFSSREVSAPTPDAVEDFMDRFDALEDYRDLEPGLAARAPHS
jgi:hypothetical protein